MRALALVVVVFASLLAPVDARAGDSDSADALLRRGVQLRREHRNGEALDVFQRAVAVSPTPTARAQVALAEEALGRWVEAELDLGAALGTVDCSWIAKNRSGLAGTHAHISS